jgi:hypothetical protein
MRYLVDQLTNFSLEKHGFLFPNRFNLKGILIFPKAPFYYGLCGGMCFTALDIYYQKNQSPDFTDPEHLPKNLLSYLIKRQLHSTGFRSLFKLLLWLFQPTTKLFDNSVCHELPRILTSLNAGCPVPIILIRSKKLRNPTNNHQILIIGYKINNAITELQSYDPNYPGRLTIMRINQESGHSEIIQSTGETVRGFFVNYYKPKTPEKIYQK